MTPIRRAARGHLWRFIIPVVLAAGWLAFALTHLPMPYPSDQLHYMGASAVFPHPIEGSALTHQMTRLGLTGPTRLVMTVFGYSQASYYVVPLLGSLALLLGTYAIGTLMFSRVVGAGAAAILLTCTPIFYDSAELLPDLLAAALFTVAVAIAIAIRQRRFEPRPWLLLLIGVLLGWSYLVREFIIFVWPLVPILLWARLENRRWLNLLWLGLPIVVLVAAETVTFWAVYGDPLARIRAVAGHGEGPPNPAIDRTFKNKPRWVYAVRPWHVLGGTDTSPFPDRWMLRFLFVGAIAGALVWRRRIGILLVWMALLYVPLTLLGGIIDPSHPKLRLQLIRYWFPMFPAFVLACVAAVWLLAGYVATRARAKEWLAQAAGVAAVAVVAVTAVVLAGGGVVHNKTAWRGDTDMGEFRAWMSENGSAVRNVWSDGMTGHTLQVFRRGPFGGQAWSAQVRRLPPGLPPGAPRPAPGDLVVVFDTPSGGPCGACTKYIRLALGSPVADPPRPTWRKVFASSDGALRAYAVTR